MGPEILPASFARLPGFGGLRRSRELMKIVYKGSLPEGTLEDAARQRAYPFMAGSPIEVPDALAAIAIKNPDWQPVAEQTKKA
jgi:hypothetical protein